MQKCNHAVNVIDATFNQSEKVMIFRRIVPVLTQSGRNRLNTYISLDSGQTVSFIDQIVPERLRFQGIDATLKISSIKGRTIWRYKR